jgi:toxin HigB-1
VKLRFSALRLLERRASAHGRGGEAKHRAILEQALPPASTGFWERTAAVHAATRGRIRVPSKEPVRRDRVVRIVLGASAQRRDHLEPCRALTALVIRHTYRSVIRSFADRRTAAIWVDRMPKGFPNDLAKAARRKLRMLESATRLEDLRNPPGNRLETLVGDRTGQYSVRVNGQWRICFVWRDGDAYDVEVVDYH